jgi:hypothetical protein
MLFSWWASRLRKRKELDALVVKGTRRRRGASQELLARDYQPRGVIEYMGKQPTKKKLGNHLLNVGT